MNQMGRMYFDARVADYLKRKAALDAQWSELERCRAALIEEVLAFGQAPPRATKTIALRGEAYEARVTRPLEVTVDKRAALRIKDALARAGSGGLFRRLFRRVESFVLADGAHEMIAAGRLPKGAPRNLRSLFARAVRVRELAPQLDIRELQDKDEAA